MDEHVAVALAWIFGACTLAAALLAVRQHRARTAERARAAEQLAAAEHRAAETITALEGVRAELRHLGNRRISGAVTALTHPHLDVPGLLDPRWAGSDVDHASRRVLEHVGEVVLAERQRVDASARSALRGATTRIQAMSYRMQELLQELQRRYDGEKVMQDLVDVDFLNEQILRRIQVTGIVSDAWPGLARADSYLSEIVMGASSRLLGYQRVQVSNQLRDPIAVVARAVEPVAVVITELLANALHHSHPDLPVYVIVQQGNRGASVIVDDAGVGLDPDEARRAAELITGGHSVLLTELGDPPRSGFAAIGQLCRAYGFQAHVETSAYGGVRAVVFIPGDPLLTLLDETQQPLSALAPRPPGDRAFHGPAAPAGTGTAPDAAHAPGDPAFAPDLRPGTAGAPGSPEVPGNEGAEADALPRRRRRNPTPAADRSTGREASGAARAPEEAAVSAEKWAALQRGSVAGRHATLSEADRTDEGNGPA